MGRRPLMIHRDRCAWRLPAKSGRRPPIPRGGELPLRGPGMAGDQWARREVVYFGVMTATTLGSGVIIVLLLREFGVAGAFAAAADGIGAIGDRSGAEGFMQRGSSAAAQSSVRRPRVRARGRDSMGNG